MPKLLVLYLMVCTLVGIIHQVREVWHWGWGWRVSSIIPGAFIGLGFGLAGFGLLAGFVGGVAYLFS